MYDDDELNYDLTTAITSNIIDDYYNDFSSNSSTCNNGLEVEGDIKANGLSLLDRLATIESVLGIPARDAEMEEKYPHLKALHDDCVEKISSALASQTYTEELEKLRTFEILNQE